MLENGADPNVSFKRTEIYCYGHEDKYTSTYITKVHVLDYIFDKAMIKLLRAYGAKTFSERQAEEREREEQERKRLEQEHLALVDHLLEKRQFPKG